jgi:sterol desaturase/sphingolipid hydroxylase (fatty acid hydroxylase superfamily)
MDEIVYKVVFQLVYQTLKPLVAFLHRDSFLYWPFILSTLLIAMLAWRFTRARGDLESSKPHWKEFFDRYLSRRLWWHASSRLDYRFYFINAILFPLIAGPLLFSTDNIATALGSLTGITAAHPAAPSFWAMLAYTVAFFIAYDLGRFVAHSLLHDIPWLWQFHKVHHSAEVLTPMTAFRAHPVDLAVMAWVPALTTGLVAWGFHQFVNASIGMITFLGLHAIIWVCNLVGNLRHWHVWLSYGPTLNRWLISPAHHQLHHSYEPRHLGCNRGFELAVWDRLYGTLYVPPQAPETFRMGLGDGSDGQWRTVWQLYTWPFQMLWPRSRTESKTPQQSSPGSSETCTRRK